MSLEAPRFGAGMCPVGCGRAVGTGHLMCGLCWSSVPQDLRRQVYKTWAKYRVAKGAAQIRPARETYMDAREAAIASVR